MHAALPPDVHSPSVLARRVVIIFAATACVYLWKSGSRHFHIAQPLTDAEEGLRRGERFSSDF